MATADHEYDFGPRLTAEEVEQEARILWDAAGNRAASPAWDQLGEVTKGIWRNRVLLGERAEPW